MIKDIAFIEPKTEHLHIFSKFDIPRLGSVLLATLMKKLGYHTKAYFLKADDVIKLGLKPDLAAISTITPTAPQSYRLADYFRAQGVPVVMGGPHVSYMLEEALEHADYCICGEGEIPLPALVESLNKGDSLASVPALAWKEKGGVHLNPRETPVRELDTLPLPDFSLLDYGKKILRSNFFNKTTIPIMTSRGCPFDCSFCSVTKMFGKCYRFRSTENIMREIRQYDPKREYFFFYDDNFTANRARAKELLKAMIRENLGFKWATQVRTDVAKDGELLNLMKEAGCSTLFIGFESVDPHALKEMKKSQSVADIKLCIREIKKRDIHIHGMFVFGFDSDTPATVRSTVKFAIQQQVGSAQFLILTPLPGTPFYDKMKKEKRLIDHGWENYDAHHVKFHPAGFTERELQWAQIKAHARFYSPLQIVKRLFQGKLKSFFISVYANKLNKQWRKLEKRYLMSLRPLAYR
jgi:radical SAM superfamily enzyme YgiQ (UPF0313 family)